MLGTHAQCLPDAVHVGADVEAVDVGRAGRGGKQAGQDGPEGSKGQTQPAVRLAGASKKALMSLYSIGVEIKTLCPPKEVPTRTDG